MEYKISPNFDESKLDLKNVDDLIDVFEDRTRYWLFEPIQNLLGKPHGDIAALGLLLTYFEGIAIYMNGKDSKNSSKPFFKEGFVDVFKAHGISNELLARVSDIFYTDARCGFFHDGFGFRSRIFVSPDANQDLIITLPKKNGLVDKKGEIQSIIVNPSRLLSAIEHHFSIYINELRSKSNLEARLKFQEACKVKWDLEGPPVVIGLNPNDIANP
jgi:hypothetical protein